MFIFPFRIRLPCVSRSRLFALTLYAACLQSPLTFTAVQTDSVFAFPCSVLSGVRLHKTKHSAACLRDRRAGSAALGNHHEETNEQNHEGKGPKIELVTEPEFMFTRKAIEQGMGLGEALREFLEADPVYDRLCEWSTRKAKAA